MHLFVLFFISILSIGIAQTALPPEKPPYMLFGYPLNSRIGIAACPLTGNSKEIALLSRQGYDIITYKTIRSYKYPLFSPHLYPVAIPQALMLQDIGKKYYVQHESKKGYNLDSLTNSFGINSLDPVTTISNIKEARAALAKGQLLIVSVYGTGNTFKEQVNDFVGAAKIAQEGGAQVLEANLSCPNVAGDLLYKQPAIVYEICKAIVDHFPDIPLIIKVGVFKNRHEMKATFLAAAQAGVRGVCGINTVPIQAIDADNNPIFGPERIISGLSGQGIKMLALQFIRNARSIIDQETLNFKLFATGGIIKAPEFDDFLSAGADIAFCATGAIIDKELARKYHKLNIFSP